MRHDFTELDDELRPIIALVQPAKFVGQPRRRRRKMFATAEPLETRTMLSAVTVAFEGTGVADLGIAVVDKPTIAAQVDVTEVDQPDVTSADQTFDDAAQTEQSTDAGESRFGASLAPIFDGSFGFDGGFGLGLVAGMGLATNGSLASTSTTTKGTSRPEFNNDAEDESESSELGHGGDVVELRLAGNGRVVAYGAARSLQDDAGLTVGDSDGPTTYVRAIDADGRAVMRLVFVQKGSRAAAPVGPQRVIVESVVVAEADLDSTPTLEESSERATLSEVATALDASQQEGTSSVSRRQESTLLTSVDRVGSRTSMMPSTAKGRPQRMTAAQHGDRSGSRETAGNQNGAIESVNDDAHVLAPFEASELAAAVFHPQPKYLVLAMLIIGSLARPFSRMRRMGIVRRLYRLVER